MVGQIGGILHPVRFGAELDLVAARVSRSGPGSRHDPLAELGVVTPRHSVPLPSQLPRLDPVLGLLGQSK